MAVRMEVEEERFRAGSEGDVELELEPWKSAP
jgi:hypothetical protein